MELSKKEKEFLIDHLKRQYVWFSGMKKQYNGFDSHCENISSILGKLGSHPIKEILEGNKKSV